MHTIIKLVIMALIPLSFAACGYDPPAVSSYQGSTNNAQTEEQQAQQPSVNQ